MSEPDEQFRARLREAVEKGGPSAGLELMKEIGFAIEKEPEAGVGLRMRFGAGTGDAFTTTMYTTTAARPAGWPPEVPFLPDVPGSLTLFDEPGRGFTVQWWKVTDPAAAAQRILDDSLAEGWRRQDAPEPAPPSGFPGMQTVVLERHEMKRIVSSATLPAFGFVQLLERRPGESGDIAPPAPPG